MCTTHVDIGKTQPVSYNALMELHHISENAALASGIDVGVIELVKIRASQINGCAFCLRMHTGDALKRGESSERLAVLSAWRETEYFTDVERAALELTEYVTLISSAHLSDDMRVRASNALTDEQIAAVNWVAIVINAFNRVAISSHLPVRADAANSS